MGVFSDRGTHDPEAVKPEHDYSLREVSPPPGGSIDEVTTEAAGESLHRGLKSRQVSMIAIGMALSLEVTELN